MRKVNKNDKDKKLYAVLQVGARMNYAIPYILYKSKNLKLFYTDAHSRHFILDLLKLIIPKKLMPKILKNLLARNIPNEIPIRFIKDCPLKAILFYSSIQREKNICRLALKNNFSGANAIYTNIPNQDIPFIKKAKDMGLFIVHEIFVTPDVGFICYEENKKFPNLSINKSYHKIEDIKRGHALDIEKWQLSDLILVPSLYCKETALRMGVDPAKLKIVPYGIHENYLKSSPKPQVGKILFVGEVSLRKGIQYLAEASKILKSYSNKYSFIAAGKLYVDSENPLFQNIKFLGHIPRNEIIKEFLTADIFVLPSLAEGMALVHLEAMSCGIPVITTPNCGSVVEDGKEGFIVPTQSPEVLAAKIKELVENRDLRDQMSNASLKKAKMYTWKNYSENLLKSLNI